MSPLKKTSHRFHTLLLTFILMLHRGYLQMQTISLADMRTGFQGRLNNKGLFIFFPLLFTFVLPTLCQNQMDAQALLELKMSVKIDPTFSLFNWVVGNYVCNWTGITCDDKQRVVRVVLKFKMLSGQIPPHIANISFLKTLDLSYNYLYGSIPRDFGKLEKLQYLNLHGNHLQGSIPPSLQGCRSLLQLNLQNNFLSGSIPSKLSSLQNLERLLLGSNNLTDVIPQELANCSALKIMHLGANLLTGGIPSKLGALSHLRVLKLKKNWFSGEIPKSLSNCTRLRYLSLSENMLEGPIPSENFRSLSRLEYLNLRINKFVGTIPEAIGYNLPRLQEIYLDHNNLSGSLPKSLGNCSALSILQIDDNKLSGMIPREMGMLTQLRSITLSLNSFHGVVFPFLFNCTRLGNVELLLNRFEGSIPVEIGVRFNHLQFFSVGGNLFSGEIPKSLGNCSQLLLLDLGGNRLSGKVPRELGMLTALEILNLETNNLSTESSGKSSVLGILTNCSNLRDLDLSQNDFCDTLPRGIGKLPPTLSELRLSFNSFTGNIPQEIGNLTALTTLYLDNNNVIGEIPQALSRLRNLQSLRLSSNKLRGSIPTQLKQLENLEYLCLQHNQISGEIPSSIGSLQQLREVDLSYNGLTGRIPDVVGQWFRLERIDLSHNSLSGNIPVEISSLHSLTFYLNFSHNSLTGRLPSLGAMQLVQAIDISANKLSGPIPGDIGSCVGLEYLNLTKNRLGGIVPTSIGQLKSLEVIDLSFNKLSGQVPNSIANLTMLRILNFSYNNLNGSVPNQGAFRHLSPTSFLSNPGLCSVSGLLNLPNCTSSSAGIRPNWFNREVVCVSIGIFLALCCILGAFYVFFRKSKREVFTNSLLGKGFMQISSHEIHTATEGFNAANLLGAGSFGSVYRGLLSDNTVVAVKVFNQDPRNSFKNFYNECRILSKIRHRNLVKVLSCCSTPEFKALLLQFMSKGSLETHLHGGSHKLSLKMRLNIALDVAHAMAYLHHDCSPPVVHCDLKPSNVLMDENMTAHVADFGIARLIPSIDSANSSGASRVKGTVGYLAPEYGLGANVTTKMDVYSFGVVVLEMMTRKRPTDEMFTGNKTLPSWVRRAFPEAVEEVVDREMVGDELLAEEGTIESTELLNLIGMALQCTRYSPGERPTMREVEGMFERIVYGSAYGNLEELSSVQSLLTPARGLVDPISIDASYSSTS